MEFGQALRQMRSAKGMGLKQLAPDLGVTHSYLSKLEHGRVRPSSDLVDRVAAYFDEDADALLLAASRVPDDVLQILRNHPDEAVALLRQTFGRRLDERDS